MLELDAEREQVVDRHTARRVAWDLLCGEYVGVEKLGCPEKWELLEYLPQARQHILTEGDIPWPLVNPDHVARLEHAWDVCHHLTEQFDVRDHREAQSRSSQYMTAEYERLRVKRRFGVWTFKEAYDTGLEASRRYYEDVGVEWPGDTYPEDWSTLNGEASFAYARIRSS